MCRAGKIVIMFSIALAASALPIYPTQPSWHLPCGPSQNINETTENGELKTTSKEYLSSVRMQHQVALTQYLVKDFDFLYEKIKIGADDHQYIPNWIPGRKEVHEIKKRLTKANNWKILHHMPVLHQHLQKFAVAFEELVLDEDDVSLREALVAAQTYLLMLLCEVESGLPLLALDQAPVRVPRDIMSSEERDPVDWTKKKIRDWGVMLKYRDYLHAWRHVFHY